MPFKKNEGRPDRHEKRGATMKEIIDWLITIEHSANKFSSMVVVSTLLKQGVA